MAPPACVCTDDPAEPFCFVYVDLDAAGLQRRLERECLGSRIAQEVVRIRYVGVREFFARIEMQDETRQQIFLSESQVFVSKKAFLPFEQLS